MRRCHLGISCPGTDYREVDSVLGEFSAPILNDFVPFCPMKLTKLGFGSTAITVQPRPR